RVDDGVGPDLDGRVVRRGVDRGRGVGHGDQAPRVEVHRVGAVDVVQGVEDKPPRVGDAAGHVDVGLGADVGGRVVRDRGGALGGVALDDAPRPGVDVVLARRYQVLLGVVGRQDLEVLGRHLGAAADVGVDRGIDGVVGPRAAEPERVGLDGVGLAVELGGVGRVDGEAGDVELGRGTLAVAVGDGRGGAPG